MAMVALYANVSYALDESMQHMYLLYPPAVTLGTPLQTYQPDRKRERDVHLGALLEQWQGKGVRRCRSPM